MKSGRSGHWGHNLWDTSIPMKHPSIQPFFGWPFHKNWSQLSGKKNMHNWFEGPQPQEARNWFGTEALAHRKKYNLPSLKLTGPLKMDGWKTTFLLGWLPGSGYVSLRAGIFSIYNLVQLPVSGGLAVWFLMQETSNRCNSGTLQQT